MGLRSLLGMRVGHQNVCNSWAHVLCRMLDAEPSVVAWSGIGVAQNAKHCDPPGGGAMAAVFGRALGSDPTSEHDFGSSWQPDLVVVQVGGNDLYGGRPPPSAEAFSAAYVALLQLIRSHRPSAPVLNLVYSLDTPGYITQEKGEGGPSANLEAHVRRAVRAYQAAAPEDRGVFVVVPESGQVWPQDGGAMEHWGITGMLKAANDICTCIERDLPQLGWMRQADTSAVSYRGAAPSMGRWVAAAMLVVAAAVAVEHFHRKGSPSFLLGSLL